MPTLFDASQAAVELPTEGAALLPLMPTLSDDMFIFALISDTGLCSDAALSGDDLAKHEVSTDAGVA